MQNLPWQSRGDLLQSPYHMERSADEIQKADFTTGCAGAVSSVSFSSFCMGREENFSCAKKHNYDSRESRKLSLNGISKKNQDDVKWKSSNKNIVQTNQKGRVRAKKQGSASVTALYRGKKYTCRISVVQKADAGGSTAASDSSGSMDPKDDTAKLTPGTSYYRDFLVDNVLHTRQDGDIHYNVYFPDSYNGNAPMRYL